jgi:6-phosphofructokinase 1
MMRGTMKSDFLVRSLGECTVPSPLRMPLFVGEDERVLVDAVVRAGAPCASPDVLELAGAREYLFFDPANTRAAIVTCGGLCPGLNDVIRGLTMVLWHSYGVRDILGLRYGYEGLIPSYGHEPIALTPDKVEDIHKTGGTILGSSRGGQDVPTQVDFLVEQGINVLFTIGGDGTQRGALDIAREVEHRGLDIAVVGVPKTIDNDVSLTERTFGFETAVAMSRVPIDGIHNEAKGVRNGVGLVKLMGRESGFIAAYATLASSDVNLVLVPEVPFTMEQVFGFLAERLKAKSHVVIVVAEGAGQELVTATGTDKSGNRNLGDVGLFLKDAITEYFCDTDTPVSVKYVDPSYTIRSAQATADDSVFCFQLAEHAVHAAMAGHTGMVVGLWNCRFVHVPVEKAVASRKRIDPRGSLWQSVLNNTGQPF